MGYSNTMVMSAGISGWLATSLPTETGDGSEHASSFRN
jgi:hypothetical protein